MQITRESLDKRLASAKEQREQLIQNVALADGYIQAVQQLIAELEAEAPVETPVEGEIVSETPAPEVS